jgi:MarR family transcriptional regulator, organic hydroperoxide resistance regulator
MDPLYELALSVKAGARELERRMAEAVQPLGLTAAQADAIVVIGQAGPLSLRELGELLIAESGHPSRLVDRLVAAGYVERVGAPGDRRRVELSLTPAGRDLVEQIQQARRGVLDLGRALLGAHDVEPVVALFRDLLQYSDYAELMERRRVLEERATGGAGRSR